MKFNGIMNQYQKLAPAFAIKIVIYKRMGVLSLAFNQTDQRILEFKHLIGLFF
jgi:hypothetical protein